MTPKEVFHVTPINDSREHRHDNDCVCWCMPKVEILEFDKYMCTHNSADGRERKPQ
jgi:hypothetical protein